MNRNAEKSVTRQRILEQVSFIIYDPFKVTLQAIKEAR